MEEDLQNRGKDLQLVLEVIYSRIFESIIFFLSKQLSSKRSMQLKETNIPSHKIQSQSVMLQAKENPTTCLITKIHSLMKQDSL